MPDPITPPLPPRYFWLWHLAALKVLDVDFGAVPGVIPPNDQTAVPEVPVPDVKGTLWDRIGPPGSGQATVALIDTGVSRKHPNLASRLDIDRSLDLTTHRYGAQAVPLDPATTPYTRETRKAFFAGLSIDDLDRLDLNNDEKDFLDSMVAEYAASQGVQRQVIDGDETFAAHGTACAGLIVGEPACVTATGQTDPLPPEALFTWDPGSKTAPDHPTVNGNLNLLPYFGVDPFSRLVSIKTSFEEDPCQFIAAFLYAWHCKVDVIVMPRGLPDPKRSRLSPKEDLKADLESWKSRDASDLFARLDAAGPDGPSPFDPQTGNAPDRPWKILKHLMVAISRHIPIVCAAGNDGESQLIYPANLAGDDNGFIAVGAVTAEGFRSGYSNYGDGLTLVAPSDDYEILNRHQRRLDRHDPMIEAHDFSGPQPEFAYSALDLVTTDLPGVFGYDKGNAPWSSVQPNPGVGGGYYTAFGGTSGASCLIGGLAALVQRARRAAKMDPLNGIRMKELMVAASSVTTAVAPGFRPLTPDPMNSDDEPLIGKAHYFGAGLPDADKLLTLATTLPAPSA